MKHLYYTGVGSRSTPADQLHEIKKVATLLAERGFLLRSGHAIGADTAFEEAAKAAGGHGEIYLAKHANAAALKMAETIHPAWNRCTPYVKNLHARNCFQVLGRDLKTPSKFLICWTADGAETETECTRTTGGTGTAIRLAHRNGIRVYNFGKKGSQTKFALCES